MKKVIYVLILPLLVVSGLVFANRETKNESSIKSTFKPPSAAEMEDGRKKWEASPDGIKYATWRASPEGEKVLAGTNKISKHINAFSSMEAIITSLSLPPGTRLGFCVMARIDGVDYLVTFDPEKSQLEQLQTLKVSDRITIKSQAVSHAPKYAYPIIKADYVEREGKVIYKRKARRDGC